MQYGIINLKVFGDDRGSLIAFEEENNIPFELKRAFYIFDTNGENVIRGAHANRNSEFALVTLAGSCKVKVDNGKKIEIFELNSRSESLYLNKMIWKEMYDFSPDSVLLVLSNQQYDENEYIRDYNDFLKEVV